MAKLKVYRTSAGFDDAYVAATSQKAALAAWGADANLFARGVAEIVDDPALVREPLRRPGEVVRIRRGTAAEHLKALDLPSVSSSAATKGSKLRSAKPVEPRAERVSRPSIAREKPPPAPKPSPVRPKPSRKALDTAEHAIAQAEAELKAKMAEIALRKRALEQEQRDLRRTFDARLRRLQTAREEEQQRFSERLAAWAADDDTV